MASALIMLGGLVGQRHVQCNVVGLGVKGVGGNQLDAELLGARWRQIRIAADELHAEGVRTQRRLGANPAKADDAKGLAGQFGALEILLVPLSGARRLVGARDVAGHGEHQSEGKFGHRDSAGSGGVHHQDAATGGNLDIDVVHADSGTADDTKVFAGFDQRGVGLHGRAHDQRIGVRDGNRGIQCKLFGGDDRAVRNRLQHLHRCPGNFLRDDDLHG